MSWTRKPWTTKEWKKRREELLKTNNKCEWCGSTEYLTIDHLHNFDALGTWNMASGRFFGSYFVNGKHQEELDQIRKEEGIIPKFTDRCWKCGKSGLIKRKQKKPPFRCSKCGWEGEKTSKTLGRMKYRFKGIIMKSLLKVHKPKINLIYESMKKSQNETYMKFEEVLVLCRRCAYARLKGNVLCKVCESNYHKPRFEMCWGCFS